MSELLTTPQVAEMLGVIKGTVLGRAKALKLNTVKVGKAVCYTPDQVEAIKNYTPKSGPQGGNVVEKIIIKNPLSDVGYFWERADALIARESVKNSC